ncbi:MAG: HesA/MoeB/ThiF family protein [candidate division FCPU426 bacterium]
MELTPDQRSRYSRHILLPEVGLAGQKRLKDSSVLVVGAGGLGCPAAQYLAAAGVGRLGLADPDKVELGNLQRQILHWDKDLGRPKVASAAEKLRGMNPDLELVLHETRVDEKNAMQLFRDYDLVVDGTDNFQSKFLVNDACVSLGKTFLHAGILRFEGQMMAVKPGSSACFRCVFSSMPAAGTVPSCAEAGVLGAVAGVMGALLADQALTLLLGLGSPLFDRMLLFDAKNLRFREVPLRRQEACPSCARAGQGFQPSLETVLDCAPDGVLF